MKSSALTIDKGLGSAWRARPFFIRKPGKPLGIVCGLLTLFLMGGCARNHTMVVLLPDSDGQVGAIEVQTDSGATRIDTAYQATAMPSRGKAPVSPITMKKKQVEALFDEVLAAEPEKRFRIGSLTFYFRYNTTELTPESRQGLPGIIGRLRKNPPLKIYLVGHTDRLGTQAHNRHLSLKRAWAVEHMLVSGGINSKTISISYFGESMPRIQTEDEIAQPLNRRVEMIMTSPKNE